MGSVRYRDIVRELEGLISSGELTAGARLPTEAELQESHQVSRGTAQRALNELAQAGLVVRRRRAGTVVAGGAPPLNLRAMLDPKVRAHKAPGRHQVLTQEVVAAGEADVDLPGVDDDVPVTKLVRVKHDLDSNPVFLEIFAVPFSVAPKLVNEDMVHQTMRSYFESIHLEVDRARMHLDAVLLDPEQAEKLAVDPSAPVLRQRRFTWLTNGQLAESLAFFIRAGAADVFVEYSLRND